MSIYERIRSELSNEYENSNQDRIAHRAKVSQVTISRYLSNINNIKAMRLDTFFSLFPDVDVLFHKSTDKSSGARLHSLIDNLSDIDKKKAWQILSAVFPEYK